MGSMSAFIDVLIFTGQLLTVYVVLYLLGITSLVIFTWTNYQPKRMVTVVAMIPLLIWVWIPILKHLEAVFEFASERWPDRTDRLSSWLADLFEPDSEVSKSR